MGGLIGTREDDAERGVGAWKLNGLADLDRRVSGAAAAAGYSGLMLICTAMRPSETSVSTPSIARMPLASISR